LTGDKNSLLLHPLPHPLEENPSRQLGALIFQVLWRFSAQLGQARDKRAMPKPLSGSPASHYITTSAFIIREGFIEPLAWK
jgi:hypothetical protein